jgi:hypothetical protein
VTRLYIHAPIPEPSLWLISTAEAPPGYVTLTAGEVLVRRRAGRPPVASTELLRSPAEPVQEVARAQLDALLALFVRMDQGQRGRLIEHAAAMLAPEPPP